MKNCLLSHSIINLCTLYRLLKLVGIFRTLLKFYRITMRAHIQGLAIPDPPSLDYGVHQYAYGTREHPYGAQGAFWHNLTDTTITIYRCPEDQYWDYVRVWLWIIPFP